MSSTGGQSPPSLALSDILVSSPPSMVISSTNAQVIGNSNVTSMERSRDAAEPLQDDEMAQFRARIEEIRSGSQGEDNLSSQEKELLDMVTRLIEAPRPNISQLEQQANAISELIAQRDFLAQQIADERTRMDSERDGFERAAEALIRQRNTKHMYPARYEEQETQIKLTCLESELFKLKPLLLMQPFPSIGSLAHTTSYLSSLPYPAPTGSAALNSEKAKAARKRKREKEKAAMQGDNNSDKDASTSKETSAAAGTFNGDGNTDSNAATSSLLDPQRQSGPSIYQHLRFSRNSQQSQSQSNQKSKSQRQRSKSPQRSENITSDARAELYVLAARKIGRERASLVSGLIAAEREREKERFKAAEEEIAKERLAGGHTGYYRNHTSTGGVPKKANKGKTSTLTQKPISSRNTTVPTSSPQSPKRGVTSAMPSMQFFPHPGSPHPHAYMFVPNANMISYQHMHAQPPGAPRIVALAAPFGAHGRMGTPNQAQNPSEQPQPQKPTSAPPGKSADAGDAASSSKTPLASLLSAARMMDDKGADDSSASSQRTNKRSTTKRKGANGSEQAENSTAKRRRVSSGNAEVGGSTKPAGKRTRSALDVLADQAAAFSQGPEDGEQRGAPRKGKGKAKTVEAEEPESETETEPSSRVATRRSSRSTRGRRKDMLIQDSLPRMISPAPGREVRKASMMPPPDPEPSLLLSPPTITVSGLNSTDRSPAEEEPRLEESSRLESVPARVKRLHGNQDPAAERARSREPTQTNDSATPTPIPIPAPEDVRIASPAPQPPETRGGDDAELPNVSYSNNKAAPESTTSVEQSDLVDKAQHVTNSSPQDVLMVVEEVNPAVTVNTNTAVKTLLYSAPVEAISQVQVASSQETLASNDDVDADGDSDPEVLP
uniref:Uncharacterized protein n=1 Tax=Moniliophthora roreri TaxID=221103 RepID=A0A0W0FXL6_MONRR